MLGLGNIGSFSNSYYWSSSEAFGAQHPGNPSISEVQLVV